MNSLFEIGQKVVCVDSSGNGNNLVEGKTYIVRGFVQCPKCKLIAINVGIKNGIDNPSGFSECTICKTKFPSQSIGECSYRETRFVPLEFDRQADEEIKNAMNEKLLISNK